DSTSSVHLSVIKGSLYGHIIIPGHTTYHIEPARNHFKHADFHSIIYPESQMNLDPYRHKRAASGICGNEDIYRKLKDKWRPVKDVHINYEKEIPLEYNMYTKEVNMKYSRSKRQLITDKTTCFMSLRADNLLYKQMEKKHPGAAKEEILSLFASHIKALNDIYPVTSFGNYRNVRFQLQRSIIMTACDVYDSRYCSDNLDVSNFLDLTSIENHDSFCLVHTFTYRDFDGGTLGLAWVATPESRNSGVCGKFGAVRDSTNKISDRSLNTGIVTFINFKQDVPSRVSQLTFAHEVGHNFGAQHDTTSACAPYGTSESGASLGNFIMFPSATQGNLPNNAKFSSCSISSISKVLDTLEPKGKRVNCFQKSNNAFCGNSVVEFNETCDCGFIEECSDKCCNGQTDNPNKDACSLKHGVCSPSQGPCCDQNTCDFKKEGINCSVETECKSFSQSKCPEPKHKANMTLCNSFSKTCINGECIGSVCSNISWIECFVTQDTGASEDAMCYISCKQSETSECISSYNTGKVSLYPEFKKLLETIRSLKNQSTSAALGVKRPAGSPCNDFKGYCDGFSKCRKVDAEGPFKQLTDLIFSPVTLGNIRSWIEEHWWAVLLMCVGVVVFMGVFIKVFSYNTPSKDPKKKTTRLENSPHRAPAGSRPGKPKPSQDKRSTVYTTDLPMYTKPASSRGASSHPSNVYDTPDDYRGSNGYDNQAFQGPSNYRGGHQQFDRVSAPRKY
ncbi:disintegrin and metalloproteinase domain-containing protein 10, partial [Biomphalaria pfeifferi]